MLVENERIQMVDEKGLLSAFQSFSLRNTLLVPL
jgi:hypothetical protein